MKLQVGNKKINIDRVLLFGTTKRTYNLDAYVLNDSGIPLGYNNQYRSYKKRKIVKLDEIKPTKDGYFPKVTREQKAIINAICDFAIVYKGATITSNERIKVLSK